jgi:regulator of protease activity HflC (stomatin/prohibitin superfamily)
MNFTSILSIAGWAALGLLVLYVFYVVSMRAQGRSMRISVVLVVVLLVAGIALIALAAGLVFVPAEERGVVVSLVQQGGLRPEPLEPGLHWIIPFAETVVPYSIANSTYTMSALPTEGQQLGDDSIEARTSDGQEVKIDASVVFRADPEDVINLHIKWQGRYLDGVVRPAARGIIRDVVSQYGVEEVYSSQRDEVRLQIQERLGEVFIPQGLELVGFILRNVAFTEEYASAIEQKQIAEQEVLRAQFLVQQQAQEAERVRVEAQGLADAVVTRAEGDAQATVLRAQADAEALRLISEAIAVNPDLLTYRYIEKLSPTIRTALLPSDAPFLLDINSLLPPSVATPAPQPTPTPEATPAP